MAFFERFLGIRSIQLDLGKFSCPGPGFAPFILTLVLFSLSFVLLIQIILLRKERGVQRLDLRISAFYIGCYIVGYVLLFKKIGYLVSTCLLMTFLFKSMGTKRWVWALGEALLVTLLSYLFFGVLLNLNLPTRIF